MGNEQTPTPTTASINPSNNVYSYSNSSTHPKKTIICSNSKCISFGNYSNKNSTNTIITTTITGRRNDRRKNNPVENIQHYYGKTIHTMMDNMHLITKVLDDLIEQMKKNEDTRTSFILDKTESI